MTNIRIGQGIDVHPLVEGKPLVLGGVTIPHTHGLEGHSDADVLIHALCDALLGAAGLGDIGVLFPNSDPQWRGARSTIFLTEVMARLQSEGWRVVNCDLTVLAERPKILPHSAAMKANLAPILGVESAAIGIKATTTERLGFVGREEGIAVWAVALLEAPTK